VIGKEEDMSIRDGWISTAIRDWDELRQYVQAVYFIVTTMTTVGYGDMSAGTFPE
jgi:hypothetical protein